MPSSPDRKPPKSGRRGMWDPMPLVPPVKPPAPPKPEEFVWSKPERLKDPPPEAAPAPTTHKTSKKAAPKTRAAKKAAKGRPVKKAARKKTTRR